MCVYKTLFMDTIVERNIQTAKLHAFMCYHFKIMMATGMSIKKDGLCSLTAQKLSEEPGFASRLPGTQNCFEIYIYNCFDYHSIVSAEIYF